MLTNKIKTCDCCGKTFPSNSNEDFCLECFGNSISDQILGDRIGIDVTVIILYNKVMELEKKIKELTIQLTKKD